MLRVDLRSFTDTHTEYTLTGSLTREYLPELQHLIDTCARRQIILTLHLAGLDRIDDTCLAYLVHGDGRSTHLSGAPALLLERLRHEREGTLRGTSRSGDQPRG